MKFRQYRVEGRVPTEGHGDGATALYVATSEVQAKMLALEDGMIAPLSARDLGRNTLRGHGIGRIGEIKVDSREPASYV